MTEINVNRKIGLFAPSTYGKGYLVRSMLNSIKVRVVIYDTDYEDAKYNYSSIPNAVVFKPDSRKGEDLDYLNKFLKVVMAKYSNCFIYIPDLDVFFDRNNQGSFDSSALKNIASKGRHQRIGLIYDAKQTAWIPTKLVGNTNLLYIGQFLDSNNLQRLKPYITIDTLSKSTSTAVEEMSKLNPQEHEFWEIDMLARSKRIVKA